MALVYQDSDILSIFEWHAPVGLEGEPTQEAAGGS